MHTRACARTLAPCAARAAQRTGANSAAMVADPPGMRSTARHEALRCRRSPPHRAAAAPRRPFGAAPPPPTGGVLGSGPRGRSAPPAYSMALGPTRGVSVFAPVDGGWGSAPRCRAGARRRGTGCGIAPGGRLPERRVEPRPDPPLSGAALLWRPLASSPPTPASRWLGSSWAVAAVAHGCMAASPSRARARRSLHQLCSG